MLIAAWLTTVLSAPFADRSSVGAMEVPAAVTPEKHGQPHNEQTIRSYVDQLRDHRLRDSASVALKEMREEALPALVEVLADEDRLLREVAANLLDSMNWQPADACEYALFLIAQDRLQEAGNLGAVAIPLLIRELEYLSWDRRMEAAQLLGRFGSQAEPAVPALIELARDINDRVRWRAVEALQRIGDERGFETWMRALGDEDARVRKVAVRALQDRPQQAVPALVERWKRLDDTRDRVERGEIETLLCEGMNGPARSYLVERLQEILEGELDQQRSVNEAQQVLLPLLAPIDPALHEHWAEAFWWKVEFPVKLSAVVMFGTALLLLVLVVGRRVLGELRGHRQSAGDLERVA